MTLTAPGIVPSGYNGDATDFLKTKVDRSGATRLVAGTVTVPASTAANTYVGLIPVNKGARISYASRVYTADLDSSTNVTFDIGYLYYDSATGSSVDAAFVSGSTAPQAGGIITFTASAGLTWSAAGDGWIVVKVKAQTTTSGDLNFQVAVSYDP